MDDPTINRLVSSGDLAVKITSEFRPRDAGQEMPAKTCRPFAGHR
jgi:hypothetical protein